MTVSTKAPKAARAKGQAKLTSRQEAEIILAQYAQSKKTKDQAAAEMKQLEDQLHQWAHDNRHQFQGAGTLSIEGGKLCFQNSGKIITDKNFDIKEFAKEFPQAVDMKPSVSKVSALMIGSDAPRIRELGVDIKKEENFSVKVA